MPRFAVPAAQHGNRLSLWLQRQAAFWRNELIIGSALVGNRLKLLKAVSVCLEFGRSYSIVCSLLTPFEL